MASVGTSDCCNVEISMRSLDSTPQTDLTPARTPSKKGHKIGVFHFSLKLKSTSNPPLFPTPTWIGLNPTFIEKNSRQNFILSPRFPRETYRSRRDLQLSLGNLLLRMKFCLEFWSIFLGNVRKHPLRVIKVPTLEVYSELGEGHEPDQEVHDALRTGVVGTKMEPDLKERSTKTLDKTSSSEVGSKGKL